MKEVLFEGIDRGEKSFSALISRIKTSGATLVYFGGFYPEAGLFVREMRQQNVNATFMGLQDELGVLVPGRLADLVMRELGLSFM